MLSLEQIAIYLALLLVPLRTQSTSNLTVESIDSVDWETDFSWTSKVDGAGGGKIDLSMDWTCYVNYNSFPLRIHCTGDFMIGYEEYIDARMSADFGAQLRWEQLQDIETYPTLDFYLAFTSPEVAWDWDVLGSQVYIESKTFPDENRYYAYTIVMEKSPVVRVGNSWEITACATLFADLISEEAALSNPQLAVIDAVAESGQLSGSDFCVTVIVEPTGRKSVDLGVVTTIYALDETRVDWGDTPGWLEALYTLVQCPAVEDWSFQNECASPRGSFEYLRELITGMDSGYSKEVNIPELIQDFIDQQREFWENVLDRDDDDEDYQKYLKTLANAGPLLTADGKIHLGREDAASLSAGAIFGIVFSILIVLMMIAVPIYYRKKGKELRIPSWCFCSSCNDIRISERCNCSYCKKVSICTCLSPSDTPEGAQKGHVTKMRTMYESKSATSKKVPPPIGKLETRKSSFMMPAIAPKITRTSTPGEREGIKKGNVGSAIAMFEKQNN